MFSDTDQFVVFIHLNVSLNGKESFRLYYLRNISAFAVSFIC